ncbi:aspartate aminotransferase [Methanosarcinales archaeon ex4484_138]|nr:MAG: aspartate aminotransferase [Methanosarcinales archaeon ex4484_138]RLG27676.1 MAG: aspartate aminotransferase [Methanosarcinales archaeon]
MKFSSRVRHIDISGIRKAFEAAGSDAINLGLGQPDFDTPEHINETAIKAIKDGFTGYTENQGILELREAVSEKFRRENRINTTPEQIIVTAGASEALHLALQAIIEPGDEVLIPDPGFVSYNALTQIAEGIPVSLPLSKDHTITPDGMAEEITPHTRALIINSPANPTGAVQTEKEIRGICELAEDHDLTIISDEVYEHIIYEGRHVSPAEYTENVITINATSKTYAMTGWRIGYTTGPTEAIEEMVKIHQYAQACATSISQKAALAALTGPQDCIKEMHHEFKTRRRILMNALQEIEIECTQPKGAFYAFPKIRNAEEVVQQLLQRGVITTPGTAFGKHGSGHIRLSYATTQENIQRAMSIMREILA